MHRRRRALAILLTSAGVTVFAAHQFIHHPNYSLRTFLKESVETNDTNGKSTDTIHQRIETLLKNKGETAYITVQFTDPIAIARYQQALYYLKLIRSENTHIREHGLTSLARLDHLSSTYFNILAQHLDYRSAIQLARTAEANSNYFPKGPPYIFAVGHQKLFSTNNVENFNDDEILLFTIRALLEKLDDDRNRPLDVLSEHYLKLVRKHRKNAEFFHYFLLLFFSSLNHI